jgi:6-phosphofructokinase 1
MGRHAGWIRAPLGNRRRRDVILIPEIPFSLERVAKDSRARSTGSNFSIIVVAEGAMEIGHDWFIKTRVMVIVRRARRHRPAPATAIWKSDGRETRCVVLGHLQRGGRPNAFDRMLATNFGSCAVRALRTEKAA